MARRSTGEEGFGSDSFLDIIANIVGILIILIVMIGLKVSRTPPASLTQSEAAVERTIVVEQLAEWNPPPKPAPKPRTPITIPKSELTDDVFAIVRQPVWAHAPPRMNDRTGSFFGDLPPAPPAPQPIPIDDELQREIARRRQAIKELERQRGEHAAKEAAILQEIASLMQFRDAEATDREARRQRAAEQRKAITILEREVADQQTTHAELAKQVKILEERPTQTETLTHRLTPVSETVSGDELFFTVEGQRVRPVPIPALIRIVKRDIERNKAWLMKSNRHQGAAGPIEGYRMNYIVQEIPLTAIERLNAPDGVTRIGVSKWVLSSDPDSPGETAADALQSGSRFVNALRAASPNTTITFFVYPDSFGTYRELQKFVQQSGFRVAARPLPKGVPISGSPNGSRSVAQ